MRNFGFDVRAGAPRRSHASSLRARFCRRASMTRGLPVALDALQDVRGVAAVEGLDDAVVHLPRRRCRPRRGTTGRGSRRAGRRMSRPSAASGARRATRSPRRRGGWWARRGRARRRRRTSSAASATRRRWPPERLADLGVPRDVGEQAGDDVARRARRPPTRARSASPTTAALTVSASSSVSAWSSTPTRTPPRHGHAARVGLEPAGEQRQQARLAVAVAADDADAVALVDAERDAVEDDLGREFQVQGLGPEKMCHVPPRLGESAVRPRQARISTRC